MSDGALSVPRQILDELRGLRDDIRNTRYGSGDVSARNTWAHRATSVLSVGNRRLVTVFTSMTAREARAAATLLLQAADEVEA